MNEQLRIAIVNYACMVLEWLDIDAIENSVPRPALVDMFMDTLNALEQNKEQED